IVTETAVLSFVACFASRMYWAALLPLPAVILTHSRGGLLALAIGMLWMAWKKAPWLAVIVAGTIALGAASLQLMSDKHADSFRGGNLTNWSSVTDRIDIWKDSANQLTWLGSGIGSFRVDFPKRPYHTDTVAVGRADYPHNDFLQFLYELGAPGL